MVAPVIGIYKENDTTPFDNTSNPIDFGSCDPGEEGPIITLNIWNNKGGAVDVSEMTDCRLTTVTKNGYLAGDSGPAGAEGAYGRFFVEDKYINVKSISDEDANFVPIGGSVTKTLSNIKGNKIVSPNSVTGTPSHDDAAHMANGTYYYVVSAFDETGETLPGTQSAAIVLSGTNNQVTLEWDEVDGAVGYKIFRTTVSGTYNTPAYIARVVGATQFIDVALTPSTGTPLATATTTHGHKNQVQAKMVIPTNADSGPVEFNTRLLYKFI